jgi:hypothetical protein
MHGDSGDAIRRALNRAPGNMLSEVIAGGNAASPFGRASIQAELIGFRCVDASQADSSFRRSQACRRL